ncbi:radical SAM protein [Aestuariirhabdus litorea]|uniref:Radical SAM protein n=1 Tax=Aestuariirhabdus litorea TaxID=2528527 RepID=A0A3P3VIB7_9GAMM|nr:radical SAM protein [Aestuariirhabdus litorea]RRJ82475.1 radical SAM protein [Aestuariirhabdus litorea]RWW92636.1 radical SAM protein [Endozoicomonadaceae bacterium GTF-13]
MQMINVVNSDDLDSWNYTANGDRRGYIEPHRLKELWFHTGTACNLSCNFCLEGSGPADTRIELIKLEEVRPYIDEAVELGVEQFSFTGGEPFVAREIIKVLQYAANHRPCLVLTNATDPLHQRREQLKQLLACNHPVSFRVSLDYPEPAAHDAGRGEGSFQQALQGMKLLQELGFHLSVARQMRAGEESGAVEKQYRQLFIEQGLDPDLRLVAFPDFLPPGSHADVPDITEHCMTHYQNEESRRQFMCAFSKMIVKKRGQLGVYACTLVDDDDDYNQGRSLREALSQRVSMKHHRCFSCFSLGSSCSEI